MSNKINNIRKYRKFMMIGILLILIVAIITLKYGASQVSVNDIFEAFTAYNKDNFRLVTIRDIRLPRWLADVIVGASLAIAGAIMQGTTKNPMADSGLIGISSGATLGVIIIIIFYPGAGRYEKMFISTLGAGLVTLLIYIIAFLGRRRVTPDRMVLSGMAISTLLSSIITSLVLKHGLSGQMIRYTSGSSANVIWKDIIVALPFFIIGLVISIMISRSLTVMNLGEDVSKGLGANVALIKIMSTIVVLILSAVAVIIIGPVGYVGLMIPYLARFMVGSDYRLILPICAVYGGLFVTVVDFVAKCIHPGLEFPIGLLITIIGVPFFIYVSRKQGGDIYADK